MCANFSVDIDNDDNDDDDDGKALVCKVNHANGKRQRKNYILDDTTKAF